MGIELKPLHYGHSDGHTHLCYSEEGDKLISCGGDGDVRIWNGFDDDDPLQTCVGEFALCVLHKRNEILVATDNTNVQILTYPGGDRNGILTKFAAHVNHICTAKDPNWIAIASDDKTVILIEKETKATKTFRELKGTPLSIAMSAKNEFLAVACGDGNLNIYNIESQSIIKQLNVAPKANSFLNAKLLCRTDFGDNKYFAYPDKNSVCVLQTSDWSEAYHLNTANVDNDYSIVAFSPCSNYIAACTLKGDLVVWALRSQSVIGYKQHGKGIAITSLAWNPKENGDLAFADIEGYVGLAVNCINNEEPTDNIDAEANADVIQDDDNANLDNTDDDSDEDGENVVSLEKLKSEVMCSEIDQMSRSPSPRPRSRTPEPPLQETFMPSSTPEHLDPRYMCWNEVGVVRCYGGQYSTENKSIEVEFHDATFHNSMMLSNCHNFTMGSLSRAALAVANSSKINVVPLEASSKEWHLNMPDDNTEIIAITTSENFVSFATNHYLVYVCTIYGIQKCMLAVPGPILAMSTFGYVLMIVYHSGNLRKGDQCLDAMLVKLDGITIVNRNIKCVLSPNSKLQWLGFTDCGTPSILDSAGMLFLHPIERNLWFPFCDTTRQRNSVLDGFFVTSINETYGTVRGIRCKGSVYPTFTPRPTESELKLEAPFMEFDTQRSKLESYLSTVTLLQIEKTSKKYKQAALTAFALAAKNDLENRACELVEMFRDEQVLDLCIKYATKLEKKRLTAKLLTLVEKMQNCDDDESDVEIMSTPSSNVIKPNSKILSSVSRILSKTATPASSQPGTSKQVNDTQESLFTPTTSKTPASYQDESILTERPKNPFLKSLKTAATPHSNPLSLTDKFAGVSVEKEAKENTPKITEKRKKPEDPSPTVEKQDKQRKLDRFLFAKRN